MAVSGTGERPYEAPIIDSQAKTGPDASRARKLIAAGLVGVISLVGIPVVVGAAYRAGTESIKRTFWLALGGKVDTVDKTTKAAQKVFPPQQQVKTQSFQRQLDDLNRKFYHPKIDQANLLHELHQLKDAIAKAPADENATNRQQLEYTKKACDRAITALTAKVCRMTWWADSPDYNDVVNGLAPHKFDAVFCKQIALQMYGTDEQRGKATQRISELISRQPDCAKALLKNPDAPAIVKAYVQPAIDKARNFEQGLADVQRRIGELGDNPDVDYYQNANSINADYQALLKTVAVRDQEFWKFLEIPAVNDGSIVQRLRDMRSDYKYAHTPGALDIIKGKNLAELPYYTALGAFLKPSSDPNLKRLGQAFSNLDQIAAKKALITSKADGSQQVNAMRVLHFTVTALGGRFEDLGFDESERGRAQELWDVEARRPVSDDRSRLH